MPSPQLGIGEDARHREAPHAGSDPGAGAPQAARSADDREYCPNCGAGELKIIAVILQRPVIEKILTHLGLDPQPPPKGRAREAGHD